MAYKIKSKPHPRFGVVYEIVKTNLLGLNPKVIDSFYVDKEQAEKALGRL